MRVKITRGAAVLACRGREWRRAMAAERSVPSARFTVDHLPPRRRYETWRESLACVFEVDGPRTLGQDDAVHATVAAQLIGPLMLARPTTLRPSWTRSPRTIARAGIDHYMVQPYKIVRASCRESVWYEE